jgi:hypothetical protein
MAYDDHADGEPMSAFIAGECGSPEELRTLLQGTIYVARFTAGFVRELGLRIVRRDIPEAGGHVLLVGGSRERVVFAGKRERRQNHFARHFNPYTDWVIGPPPEG